MRTAIYIEDGLVQLVLTPDNEWEKNALKSFEGSGKLHAQVFHGAFYDCRGGWTRQSGYYSGGIETSDRSLILRNQPQTIPADNGGAHD